MLLPVVVAGFYPPPYGGESIHVSKLSEHLATQGLLRARVDLSRRASRNQDHVPARGALRLARALGAYAKPGSILHLHTHGHSWRSWTVAAFAAVAIRRSGAVGILTLHSGLGPAYLRRFWAPRMLHLILASFRRIICVNREIVEVLEELGIEPDRIRLIPAFLPGRSSSPERAEVEAMKGLSPLLAVVSGKGPEYGVEILLDALPSIAARHPEIGCLILGIENDASLSKCARENGVAKHVRFLGPMPHDRCLGWIESADLFIRPSLADGDALSVREALAAGIPVVASDTGCRPEGVRLFRTGDRAELAAKTLAALDERSSARPGKQPDFLRPLLDVYREAGAESGQR